MAAENPKEPADSGKAKGPVEAPKPVADLQIQFAARTHAGKTRLINQDQYLIARLRKSVEVLETTCPADQDPHPLHHEACLLLVADGMGGAGGATGGTVASTLVVREVITHMLLTAKWFFRLDDPDEAVRLRLLREALERVDQKIITRGESEPQLAGMGTTMTGMTILGDEGFVVHVGDSRAYLLHEGKLEQLTTDHSIVEALVRQGQLTAEQARTHKWRHVLTNVIGGTIGGVQGEVAKFQLADGDRVLLCTDGLHAHVEDGQIAAILAGAANPEAACRELVDAALARGGPDNITAVAASCFNPPPQDGTKGN